MAVTPNGRTLYVQHWRQQRDSDPGGNQHRGPPHSSPAPTVHPRHHAKQQTLYVTGGANLLTPIRTSTNDPGAPIVVGVSTSAIGFAVVG